MSTAPVLESPMKDQDSECDAFRARKEERDPKDVNKKDGHNVY